MKKLYFAGGWFTPEMEEEHTRLYELIKNDFDVFNPKLESLITKESTDDDMTQTLMGNVNAILNSDLVVVIYDRKDVGTIWESGYAYANNKPIIYYAEALGNKPFNLMLAKTGLFAKNEKELMTLLNDESSYSFKKIHTFEGDVE